MKIDHLSLSTTPIFLLDNDKIVSQGTGFYYVHQEDKINVLYLITNYHVLTGSSPTEKKSNKGNSIIFQFHQSEEDLGKIKSVKLSLYTKNNKPIWVQNSSLPEADLAVIPLPISIYQDFKINCISAKWAESNLKVRPTTRITLIGYPYGFYDKKNSLPIWKTGSIASEPEIDFENKPLFLIDVSAFPGMSGSPVFAISYGTYEQEEGGTAVGNIRKFLGIYASMQMVRENIYLEEIVQDSKVGIILDESLQIGHVWKANLILETTKMIDVEKYSEDILKSLK